jgi:hypothetical protein
MNILKPLMIFGGFFFSTTHSIASSDLNLRGAGQNENGITNNNENTNILNTPNLRGANQIENRSANNININTDTITQWNNLYNTTSLTTTESERNISGFIHNSNSTWTENELIPS